MNLQSIQQIPTNLNVIDKDFTEISFTLPNAHVKAFMYVFQSMAALMSSINWKLKIDENLIHARVLAKKEETQKRIEAFETDTIECFKTHINNGSNGREALSLTVSFIGNNYAFSSYDNVKKLLIKNKLIKNTGFYKSRHKFD